MFDNLPSLSAPMQNELQDELDRYLSTDPEMVEDVLMWWNEGCGMYPTLSCMALDYLTIPGAFLSSKIWLSAQNISISYLCQRQAYI
jgi:hypothetical protein